MTAVRRWLERVMTAALLTACGDPLPGVTSDPDGGAADAGNVAPDGDVDAGGDDGAASDGKNTCARPSSVVAPSGCASPHASAQPQYVDCTTFDDDAMPINAAAPLNGQTSFNADASISPPNSARVVTNPGESEVFIADEVGYTSFGHVVLEADVRVQDIGVRFTVAALRVTMTQGGAFQDIALVVEPDGSLTMSASLPGGGFATGVASAAGEGLCPGRWSHVKLALHFLASSVDVEVALDGSGVQAPFPTNVSPASATDGLATGRVGVRATQAGAGVTLDVDNKQLYVY